MSRILSCWRVRSVGLMVVLLVLAGDRSASATGTSDLVAVNPAPTGFVMPVARPLLVLTPFRLPPTRYGAGHRGVDLAAAAGSPVRAAGSGTVVYAGPLAGRGVVSIDHPVGIRTTYEPVAATIRAGDTVVSGQVLGVLEAGHPSCVPAACLHWGARLSDGSYLDPLGLLLGLRVRLLPWKE